MEEVYGKNGLANKQAYIIKMIKSCKTATQLENCYNWGEDIIWNNWKINRPHLSFKWQLEYDCERRHILNNIADMYITMLTRI